MSGDALHVCPICGGMLTVDREEIWRYPVHPVTGNMLIGKGKRYDLTGQGAPCCAECGGRYRYIDGQYVRAND